MKKKSLIIILFTLTCVVFSIHAQDTVSEGDPWYLFAPHGPLAVDDAAWNPNGNHFLLNMIKQCYAKDSGTIVYGVAITAKEFPFNIETVYPPTMILYRHRAAGDPPSIAFVDSSNAYYNMYKSCLFNYVIDDNSFNMAGNYVRPCHEFYFNTPHPIDSLSDTFYISHYWPMERHTAWGNWWFYEQNMNHDLIYCVDCATAATTSIIEPLWQSGAIDTITNGNLYLYSVWGGIFPIVKLRCVSPRLWLSEQGYRTTTVAWRQNDTPEQYQLAIGPCGSVPDSGTSVYTTDTTYTFANLEPDTCYSVWVRKACRYTTAGYDTVVWSNWSNELIFTTVGIDEVEGQGVRIRCTGNTIVVEGAEGREVRVYDMMGREVIGKRRAEDGKQNFIVPTAGVYMVRIDNLPARRVVVIK